MMKNKKLLQLNVVFEKGSTGKLVSRIHEYALKSSLNSYVMYGRGNKIQKEKIFKVSTELEAKLHAVLTKISGFQFLFSYFSTRNIIKHIKRIRPDVVHLHCLNGYFVNIYKLLDYLASKNIRTIITLHAEFMYTGGCGHTYGCSQYHNGCVKCPILAEATGSLVFDQTPKQWRLMKESVSRYAPGKIRFVAVSNWIERQAKLSGIIRNREISTIYNGVSSDFRFSQSLREEKRRSFGLTDDKKMVMFVTPSFKSPNKGGRFLIELANRLKDEEKILFLIVGYDGKTSDLPSNIVALGHTKNVLDLAGYYNASDSVIVLSQRETFSMVTAEAMSCGSPVVGFRSGGPEEIAMADHSDFVEYGDVLGLSNSLKKMLKRFHSREDIASEAKTIFSDEIMFKRYRRLYEK